MLHSKRLNALSSSVIGAAIEVHRHLGPGLLESLYVDALCHEFKRRHISSQRQVPVPVSYKGELLGGTLKLDLLVSNEIIVEVKAVEELLPVHESQLLTYLRLAEKDLGLLLNFNVSVLKDGIRRRLRKVADADLKPLPVLQRERQHDVTTEARRTQRPTENG